MKAKVEFVKTDINELLNEALWRQGFQLVQGENFDWRMRPTVHVQANVESLQLTADNETRVVLGMVQRLRDCMAELQQLSRYSHVVHLLERAVVHLEHAGDDVQNGVIHKPMTTIDALRIDLDHKDSSTQMSEDIPPMSPPPSMVNQRTVRVEADVTHPAAKFSSDISTIVQKSRQLLANESLDDPRKSK